MSGQLPTEIRPSNRLLTAAEFHRLADVPPEVEWFANLTNAHTRRAYENAVRDFMRFAGIGRPEEFRTVTRAHIIAWRDDLVRRGLGGSTIRHRLASLASLFEYLCEQNAVTHNPVKGVERPRTESGEGKTPALGDHQARKLLAAPEADTIKSKRDRAILSTLLFHALRREELCKLKVKDASTRAKACRISRCPAKAARRGICRCIPAPRRSSTTTSRPPATARMKTARCSADPQQPHRPARRRDHAGRHLQAGARLLGAARFRDRRACACARRPPPTRSTMRPTSPRCRNGLGTRTSAPRGSTIIDAHDRRIARRSK